MLKGQQTISPVAYIETDFSEKFGIPRQSGIVEDLTGIVRLIPPYNDMDALAGLEEFSHIWLIWQFSENVKAMENSWKPMVRPPALGGNEKRGVFATRSPFRPNNMGLSVVEIEAIGCDDKGPFIKVRGADILDGTPVYDIKPYIPYADIKKGAKEGFTVKQWEGEENLGQRRLKAFFPEEAKEYIVSKAGMPALKQIEQLLSIDPRPAYIEDPQRVYGMTFKGFNVKFKVCEDQLTVIEVE